MCFSRSQTIYIQTEMQGESLQFIGGYKPTRNTTLSLLYTDSPESGHQDINETTEFKTFVV